ncbi:Exonuclease V [Sesbania bispinosa]|nr:Exonuclease V [Sesbania bispinosa]
MAGTSSKTPIEITSDKEIVSIEAALAFAASSPVTPAAPREAYSAVLNLTYIEDYGNLVTTQKKKSRAADTLLDRFRSKRGLFVTDVTKTKWCDKQMEFSLFAEEWCSQTQTDFALVYRGGGRKNNDAMQAGIARHIQLQQEVLEAVEVSLTRELPIVSFAFAHGIWMVGKIDEIQMPKARNDHNPVLVETRYTSYRSTEKKWKDSINVLQVFELLMLIMKLDQSVLDEEKFAYDDGWIKSEIWNCLEFWLGHPAYIGTESSETLSEDDDSNSSDYY